ncbi:uncharacterized protein [Branchiostoma lanceolatum]|uniref:uncharacterized protein n=1 Tax=Branchiostoma lanceolatum TaxID=7740 RepID=UPI003456E0EE
MNLRCWRLISERNTTKEVDGDRADVREVVDGDRADVREEVDGDRADVREEVDGDRADVREVVDGDRADVREEVDGDRADVREEVDGDRADVREEVDGDRADVREVVDGDRADVREEVDGDRADVREVVDGDRADVREEVDGDRADVREVVDGERADVREVVDGDRADVREEVDGDRADVREVVDGDRADVREEVDGDRADVREVVDGDRADVREVDGDADVQHPLESAWTFWYISHNTKNLWGERLQLVNSINTVENFWNTYNHLSLPSYLPPGSGYCLFKTGISPSYEDHTNSEGGKWVIRYSRSEVRNNLMNKHWLYAQLMMIGNQSNTISSNVCGGIVSNLGSGGKIELWTSHTNQPVIHSVGQYFRTTLEPDLPRFKKIRYYTHTTKQNIDTV